MNLESFPERFKDFIPNDPRVVVLDADEVDTISVESSKSNQCETNVYKYIKSSDKDRYFPVGGYFVTRSDSLGEHWWVYDAENDRHFDITPDEEGVPEGYIKAYIGLVNFDINDDIANSDTVWDVEFLKGGAVQTIFNNLIKQSMKKRSMPHVDTIDHNSIDLRIESIPESDRVSFLNDFINNNKFIDNYSFEDLDHDGQQRVLQFYNSLTKRSMKINSMKINKTDPDRDIKVRELIDSRKTISDSREERLNEKYEYLISGQQLFNKYGGWEEGIQSLIDEGFDDFVMADVRTSIRGYVNELLFYRKSNLKNSMKKLSKERKSEREFNRKFPEPRIRMKYSKVLELGKYYTVYDESTDSDVRAKYVGYNDEERTYKFKTKKGLIVSLLDSNLDFGEVAEIEKLELKINSMKKLGFTESDTRGLLQKEYDALKEMSRKVPKDKLKRLIDKIKNKYTNLTSEEATEFAKLYSNANSFNSYDLATYYKNLNDSRKLGMKKLAVSYVDGTAWVRTYIDYDELYDDDVVREILRSGEDIDSKQAAVTDRVREILESRDFAEYTIQDVSSNNMHIDIEEVYRLVDDWEEDHKEDEEVYAMKKTAVGRRGIPWEKIKEYVTKKGPTASSSDIVTTVMKTYDIDEDLVDEVSTYVERIYDRLLNLKNKSMKKQSSQSEELEELKDLLEMYEHDYYSAIADEDDPADIKDYKDKIKKLTREIEALESKAIKKTSSDEWDASDGGWNASDVRQDIVDVLQSDEADTFIVQDIYQEYGVNDLEGFIAVLDGMQESELQNTYFGILDYLNEYSDTHSDDPDSLSEEDSLEAQEDDFESPYSDNENDARHWGKKEGKDLNKYKEDAVKQLNNLPGYKDSEEDDEWADEVSEDIENILNEETTEKEVTKILRKYKLAAVDKEHLKEDSDRFEKIDEEADSIKDEIDELQKDDAAVKKKSSTEREEKGICPDCDGTGYVEDTEDPDEEIECFNCQGTGRDLNKNEYTKPPRPYQDGTVKVKKKSFVDLPPPVPQDSTDKTELVWYVSQPDLLNPDMIYFCDPRKMKTERDRFCITKEQFYNLQNYNEGYDYKGNLVNNRPGKKKDSKLRSVDAIDWQVFFEDLQVGAMSVNDAIDDYGLSPEQLEWLDDRGLIYMEDSGIYLDDGLNEDYGAASITYEEWKNGLDTDSGGFPTNDFNNKMTQEDWDDRDEQDSFDRELYGKRVKASADKDLSDYKQWVKEEGHIVPSSSSILEEYLKTHSINKEQLKNILNGMGWDLNSVSSQTLLSKTSLKEAGEDFKDAGTWKCLWKTIDKKDKPEGVTEDHFKQLKVGSLVKLNSMEDDFAIVDGLNLDSCDIIELPMSGELSNEVSSVPYGEIGFVADFNIDAPISPDSPLQILTGYCLDRLLSQYANCISHETVFEVCSAAYSGEDKGKLIRLLDTVSALLGLERFNWAAEIESSPTDLIDLLISDDKSSSSHPMEVDLEDEDVKQIAEDWWSENFDNLPPKLFLIDRLIDQGEFPIDDFEPALDSAIGVLKESLKKVKAQAYVKKIKLNSVKVFDKDSLGRVRNGEVSWAVTFNSTNNKYAQKTIFVKSKVLNNTAQEIGEFEDNLGVLRPLSTYNINNLF